MLVACRTLHYCFFGEEHMSLNRLSPKLDWRGKKNTFPVWFWETSSWFPGRRGSLMLTHSSHLGTNALWCGKTKFSFYVLFSIPTFSLDLTPLNPETCWNLTPQNWLPVCHAIWTFQCDHWDGIPQKSSGSFFRLWIFRLILLPFSFPFPESQGRLVKSC